MKWNCLQGLWLDQKAPDVQVPQRQRQSSTHHRNESGPGSKHPKGQMGQVALHRQEWWACGCWGDSAKRLVAEAVSQVG